MTSKMAHRKSLLPSKANLAQAMVLTASPYENDQQKQEGQKK
jgi:hypothetical protein